MPAQRPSHGDAPCHWYRCNAIAVLVPGCGGRGVGADEPRPSGVARGGVPRRARELVGAAVLPARVHRRVVAARLDLAGADEERVVVEILPSETDPIGLQPAPIATTATAAAKAPSERFEKRRAREFVEVCMQFLPEEWGPHGPARTRHRRSAAQFGDRRQAALGRPERRSSPQRPSSPMGPWAARRQAPRLVGGPARRSRPDPSQRVIFDVNGPDWPPMPSAMPPSMRRRTTDEQARL